MGILDNLIDKFTRTNTLYYPGCLSRYGVPEYSENYKKILDILGVEYIVLNEKEFCCGSPALNAGYRKDFEELAEKNYESFREHGVKKIITSCPSCHHIFNSEYSGFSFWDIESEHITKTIIENIRKLDVKKNAGKRAAYHDPCHLGRMEGIYEAPRKVIEKLGYSIVEMRHERGESLCCGAGGGVKTNFPEKADLMGEKRMEEAEDARAEVLITACPMCAKQLETQKGIPVKELSEVILENVGD